MTEGPFLKGRRDLAQILIHNEFDIPCTSSRILEVLNLMKKNLNRLFLY